MKKFFVFDLDDTLIDNVHDYSDPILDAARLIIHTLGNIAPHVTQIIVMEYEIDRRRVKEINPDTGKPFLFSMERFPGSLRETYREICKKAKIVINNDVEKRLYEIGMTAFDATRYVRNINPNAFLVLEFLRGMGNTLVLCSKGDNRVQAMKLYALKKMGINHFNEVIVVDDKSTEVFSAIRQKYDGLSGFYSIGNSYDSDILPALGAGF